MATRINREIHYVEQTKKVIPLISWETSFGQNVSKLVFGVHIFDLDFGFHIDSVKQQVKSNSVGSRHVSHLWTPSFNSHFAQEAREEERLTEEREEERRAQEAWEEERLREEREEERKAQEAREEQEKEVEAREKQEKR